MARRLAALTLIAIGLAGFFDCARAECPRLVANSQPLPVDVPNAPGLEVEWNGDQRADWAYPVGFVDAGGRLFFIGLQFRLSWEFGGELPPVVDPDACPVICVRERDGRLEVTQIWENATALELDRNPINLAALAARPCLPPRPTNLRITT